MKDILEARLIWFTLITSFEIIGNQVQLTFTFIFVLIHG